MVFTIGSIPVAGTLGTERRGVVVMLELTSHRSGARIYQVDGPGALIGVAHDRRVYWATPEGWCWVLDQDRPDGLIRREGYRVLGSDGPGWGDQDYYLRMVAV